MSRARKLRADGSPIPRSAHGTRPPPSPEVLESLEDMTDSLPEPLRAFRDLYLLSPERRSALERAIEKRTRSLCLALHGIHDPHNQAAVIRTSEAMGFQELHVVKVPGVPWKPSQRVTQAAHRWVDLVRHDSFFDAAKAFRSRGMRIVASAIAEDATPLHDLDTTQPTAIVLGSEARGLPADVLEDCDEVVYIPLHGLTTSLNVSVAAAIMAAHAVEVRRRRWGATGDLHADEKMELRRRFYLRAAGRVPDSLRERLEAL